MNLAFVFISDDETGEVEGVFDATTGKLIHWWACNDAMWRSEYFDPFLEAIGCKIVKPTRAMIAALRRDVIGEE